VINEAFKMQNVAELIFSKLEELHPNIDKKGVIAGQAVASLYQQIIGSDIVGQVNDIDQFVMVSNFSELYKQNKGFNAKLFLDSGSLFLGQEGLDEDCYRNYSYSFRRKKGGYFVFKSTRDGLLNKVYGNVDSGVKFGNSPYQEAKLIVDSFDLNCVQIGIYFEDGKARLYKTEDYDEFLLRKEILLVTFFSYISSFARAYSKSQQMNCYFNVSGYSKLFNDDVTISLLPEFMAHNIKDDDYSKNRYADVYSLLGIVISERDNNFIMANELQYNTETLKGFMQSEYGIAYGYRRKELALLKDSFFHFRPALAVEVKKISRENISLKKIKSMANSFYNSHRFSGLCEANLNALYVAQYLEKNSYETIGIIESLIMSQLGSTQLRKKHSAYLKKVELCFLENQPEELIKITKEISKEIEQTSAYKIKGIAKFLPKSFLGYKLTSYTTQAELSALGKEEKHCVGGYWISVYCGERYVFSLEKKGEVKTVSSVYLHSDAPFSLEQQYAKSNSRNFPARQRKIASLVVLMINVLFNQKGLAIGLITRFRRYNIIKRNISGNVYSVFGIRVGRKSKDEDWQSECIPF
jgi:hypothetical protein